MDRPSSGLSQVLAKLSTAQAGQSTKNQGLNSLLEKSRSSTQGAQMDLPRGNPTIP